MNSQVIATIIFLLCFSCAGPLPGAEVAKDVNANSSHKLFVGMTEVHFLKVMKRKGQKEYEVESIIAGPVGVGYPGKVKWSGLKQKNVKQLMVWMQGKEDDDD